MKFEMVNVTALTKAAELAVGPQGAEIIRILYHTIDQAMKEAFEAGEKKGITAIEEASAVAFDDGYEMGHEQASFEAYVDGAKDGANEGYEDGYVDGVADARAWPSYADEVIAGILAQDDASDAQFVDAYFDEAYERALMDQAVEEAFCADPQSQADIELAEIDWYANQK
jgi:hypothetical protein